MAAPAVLPTNVPLLNGALGMINGAAAPLPVTDRCNTRERDAAAECRTVCLG
eukprot:m.424774 g.424774  ORF g.424774 m.424774 type:complete len:52 (-) comp48707_c0_seq1:745-900(-)